VEYGNDAGHVIELYTYPWVSIHTILNCDPTGLDALNVVKSPSNDAHGFVPGGHVTTLEPEGPVGPIGPVGPVGGMLTLQLSMFFPAPFVPLTGACCTDTA
jgi:hypothetical protein